MYFKKLCLSLLVITFFFSTTQLARAHQQSTVSTAPTATSSTVSTKTTSSTADANLSKNAYIPANTTLNLLLLQDISSRTAKVGDSVFFITKTGISINDILVIPAGSSVIGKIIAVKTAGMWGKDGSLSFSMDSTTTINNISVPLTGKAEYTSSTNESGINKVTKVLSTGNNITCYAGTVYDAVVAKDVDLGIPLSDLSDALGNLDKNITNIVL